MLYRNFLKEQDKFEFTPAEMNPDDREALYDFLETLNDNNENSQFKTRACIGCKNEKAFGNTYYRCDGCRNGSAYRSRSGLSEDDVKKYFESACNHYYACLGRRSGKTLMASRFWADFLENRNRVTRLGAPCEINKVIFNPPATIVLWSDGTKTVVKCQPGDIYDPEKGLAMAISKKALGNQGNYCEVFKKWLPEEKNDEFITGVEVMTEAFVDAGLNAKTIKEAMDNVMKSIKRKSFRVDV